jgi:hypothetical protein
MTLLSLYVRKRRNVKLFFSSSKKNTSMIYDVIEGYRGLFVNRTVTIRAGILG